MKLRFVAVGYQGRDEGASATHNMLSLREWEDPRPGPLRDQLPAETAECRIHRGLREQVLEHDGCACRVCGDPDPGVHHREPGKSMLHLMIALCAECHAKVHRTKGCPYGVSASSAVTVARATPRRSQTIGSEVPLDFEPTQED
jgi:hypothetical protein